MAERKNPTVGKIEQLTTVPDPNKLIEYAFRAEEIERAKPTFHSDYAPADSEQYEMIRVSDLRTLETERKAYKERWEELVSTTPQSAFVNAFTHLQTQAYQNARAKGWWKERELLIGVATKHSPELGKFAKLAVDAMSIALQHAELSEALEYLRHGNPPSDHIPEFTGAEEEYADTIIRIFDNAEHNQQRVAEAIVAKMEFNEGREYKHGGKSF